MKIIISHDVDHLHPSEHFFRDLIFPKLWFRSLVQLLKKEISFSSFFERLFLIFRKRLNCIPEIIQLDKQNGIPSTFFFGMANILGMSYKQEQAEIWIKYVQKFGFDVGVHGVEIEDENKMLEEFHAFQKLSGLESFGIRTHYVRYNTSTFDKMCRIGYLFDTSVFDRQNGCKTRVYQVGDMWEFPLCIMDTYMMQGDLKKAQENTIIALKEAQMNGVKYFTFLFHDTNFNNKTNPKDRMYYEWFVDYCKNQGYKFVSYLDALLELE